jgi:hypothetical protein
MFTAQEILEEFIEAARLPPRKLRVGDLLHNRRWKEWFAPRYEAAARARSAALFQADGVQREACECGGVIETRPGTTRRSHVGGNRDCRKR